MQDDDEDSTPAFARPPSKEEPEEEAPLPEINTNTNGLHHQPSSDLLRFSSHNSSSMAGDDATAEDNSADLLGFDSQPTDQPAAAEAKDLLDLMNEQQPAVVSSPSGAEGGLLDAPSGDLLGLTEGLEPVSSDEVDFFGTASPAPLGSGPFAVGDSSMLESQARETAVAVGVSGMLDTKDHVADVAAEPASAIEAKPLAADVSTVEPIAEQTVFAPSASETATLSAAPETGQSSFPMDTASEERIAALERQLVAAREEMNALKQATSNKESESAQLVMELQSSLQEQMALKAEAENHARLADSKLQDLQALLEKQTSAMSGLSDMQQTLEEHMNAKAEAENTSRLAMEKIAELEQKVGEQSEAINKLERQVVEAREAQTAQEAELQQIREERDEQHRKEMSLVSRLNEFKKKQGAEAHLKEQFEDEIKALELDLDSGRKEIADLTNAKTVLEKELEKTKQSAQERIRRAEAALSDERALNEERKQKMKAFVASRAEELNQAKADNESLQSELNQTNRSLMDLNNRWKQLHAQWVQSQTRNRELQRDLNRIKKDSENLHKVGDSLEMKLTRSATETEEHKNKRLAAKHELMTVLRTLEMERDVSARLRDSIKFTFTPKAVSQQQLLQKEMEDFESLLQKLSTRLGKPLPPPAQDNLSSHHEDGDHSESSTGDHVVDLVNGDDSAHVSRTNADAERLTAKLEYETQRVSQCIMELSSSIERMEMLLNASGDRTCYSVLSELLTTGSMNSPAATSDETTSMTGRGAPRRLGSIRSHNYGQVPSTSRD